MRLSCQVLDDHIMLPGASSSKCAFGHVSRLFPLYFNVYAGSVTWSSTGLVVY